MTNYLNSSPKLLNKVYTLVDLLRFRALQDAKQTGYIFLRDGETASISLTYQELDEQAQAIAAYLQSLGATNKRALLIYPPGLELIAAFFGCLYAGVVAVPAYPCRPNQSMSRLQAIIADAQATLALTTTSLLTNIQSRFAQNPELAATRWLTTDSIANNWAAAWQEPAVNSNTLAFLQYTSGSTGTPKGVMVNHGNLLHNLELIRKSFEHTPDSRGVFWLPPYHDMGLIGGVLQPLYGGCQVTLMSPMAFLQKPVRWLQAISDYKATTSGGPNFAYDLCVRKITPEQRATLDLSRWELAFNGAEPIRAETLEQFAQTFADCGFRKEAFYPCYGMAETTLIISGGLKTTPPIVRQVNRAVLEKNQVVATADEQQDPKAIVGVGRTRLDQKILIVDPQSLTPCPPDKVGEIWVSSPSVAYGYWNRPEETKQTFHAYLTDTGVSENIAGNGSAQVQSLGPFLRTGDLGFLQDEELFITGRLKDMIIIRGKNHYPQDIELTVQKSHPALQPNCGAAFAVEIYGEEQLVVVQEVERSYLRKLNVDEVVKEIRQAVSQQHELQVYAVALLKTASIPKTSSGKIQRHTCRIGFLDGSLDVVASWTANLQEIDLQKLQTEAETLWQRVQNSSQQELFSDQKDSHKSLQPLSSDVTQEAIASWLVSHLALCLNISPQEIDTEQPFAAYGLDSSVAVSITGELAQGLGCELEPTLFWEYPSIEMLAQHLAAESQLLRSTNSPVGV
ncbi:AMP-binding protein [Nostoc sp.]|uniref:AMP-binding protein n=1 Tax=Nostoc sp. TaxID=1180 RepID=UPI002FFB495F